MSIQRILTFLEVAETGSLIKAAKQLNLTQSAASTRIKLLEEELQQPLFVRSASGMRLSPAGERFRPYALRMAQSWQQGRQNLKLQEGFAGSVSVAIQLTSWVQLAEAWVSWMRDNAPGFMLRVEADWSQGMVRNLTDGYFDVIVTSVPTMIPGFVIKPYISNKLLLVATRPNERFEHLAEDYIHVDWGPQFNQKFSLSLTEPLTPGLTVGMGDMAQQIILSNGGSAYLAAHVVEELIEQQQLFPVDGAPEMNIVHYLIYPKVHHKSEGIERAVRGFLEIAGLPDETNTS